MSWDDDPLDGFVTVDEAAEQMAISRGQVRQLIQDRVLRSAGSGYGLLVQPAITNRS
ncbi:hypothetical protein BH09ACT7_BH09ACT7_18330 [soil metagenome]